MLIRVAAANRRWLGGFIAMGGGLGLQVVALTLGLFRSCSRSWPVA